MDVRVPSRESYQTFVIVRILMLVFCCVLLVGSVHEHRCSLEFKSHFGRSFFKQHSLSIDIPFPFVQPLVL